MIFKISPKAFSTSCAYNNEGSFGLGCSTENSLDCDYTNKMGHDLTRIGNCRHDNGLNCNLENMNDLNGFVFANQYLCHQHSDEGYRINQKIELHKFGRLISLR